MTFPFDENKEDIGQAMIDGAGRVITPNMAHQKEPENGLVSDAFRAIYENGADTAKSNIKKPFFMTDPNVVAEYTGASLPEKKL